MVGDPEKITEVPKDFKAPPIPKNMEGVYSLAEWRTICWSDHQIEEITRIRQEKRKKKNTAPEAKEEEEEEVEDLEIDFG